MISLLPRRQLRPQHVSFREREGILLCCHGSSIKIECHNIIIIISTSKQRHELLLLFRPPLHCWYFVSISLRASKTRISSPFQTTPPLLLLVGDLARYDKKIKILESSHVGTTCPYGNTDLNRSK